MVDQLYVGNRTSLKTIVRLYEGTIKALCGYYQGSVDAALKLY